jgi:hypothetical protein
VVGASDLLEDRQGALELGGGEVRLLALDVEGAEVGKAVSNLTVLGTEDLLADSEGAGVEREGSVQVAGVGVVDR